MGQGTKRIRFSTPLSDTEQPEPMSTVKNVDLHSQVAMGHNSAQRVFPPTLASCKPGTHQLNLRVLPSLRDAQVELQVQNYGFDFRRL
jgi:hypothetical protein